MRRVEDDALLRGAGSYLDDVHLDAERHEVAFLRSDLAHADQRLPGVPAVLDGKGTSADLDPMVFDIARMVPESIRRSADVDVRVRRCPPCPPTGVSPRRRRPSRAARWSGRRLHSRISSATSASSLPTRAAVSG